jgi:hypothetical protein
LIVVVSVLLLFMPVVGILLDAVWLHSCCLLVALDVVRNVRWRRDYEVTLFRLIRTMQNRESI